MKRTARVLVWTLVLAGCGKNEGAADRCGAGELRPCACPAGGWGTQECLLGTLAWGECSCAPADAADDALEEEEGAAAEPDAAEPGPPDETAEAQPDGIEDGIADAGQEEEAPARPAPPPPRPYSGGTCPVIAGGPDAATSVVAGFRSAGDTRKFRLIVPASYDGTEDWPILFAWHWLNASSSSFVREGDLVRTAEEMRMLVVVPDLLEKDDGSKAYFFDWPFDPFSTNRAREKEVTFFDDLLTCIDLQFRVDRSRVHGVGVSAGGLWIAYLVTTDRADYFASILSLSGGLAEIELFGTSYWSMPYAPQTNKFPAVVLWGGPLDIIPPINFQLSSKRFRDALVADGHFVVTCTHTSGHAVPPIDPPPDGGTRFRSLWTFLLDHPYGLPPGWSPYQATGLPEDFPDWCAIATP